MGNLLYLDKQMFAEFIRDIEKLKVRKMTHDQIRLMFKVLCTGAFRISEVLNLTPEDIMADGKLRLRHTKGGRKPCKCSKWSYRPLKLISSDPSCTRCHGKGKYMTEQMGWIQDDILQELKEHAQTKKIGERLFPLGRHQVLNYANSLIGARTHTFRHSWLTWMVETDKLNIRDIKEKARHTNIATTDNYIQKNPDAARKREADIMRI